MSDPDKIAPLIGVAAVTDMLLQWLGQPGADDLASEELLADLRALRDRIELRLQAAADARRS